MQTPGADQAREHHGSAVQMGDSMYLARMNIILRPLRVQNIRVSSPRVTSSILMTSAPAFLSLRKEDVLVGHVGGWRITHRGQQEALRQQDQRERETGPRS